MNDLPQNAREPVAWRTKNKWDAWVATTSDLVATGWSDDGRKIEPLYAAPLPRSSDESAQPRVTDNDSGEITVTLDGKELRGWSYKDNTERRTKMLAAREYVGGWCDGRSA